MVAISLVRQSNEQLRNLPSHLSSPTAVFAGATRGIGLATLRQLAIHTVNPTCYIVGRSEAKGQEVVDELKELNGKGKYVFVEGEVSLLEGVDKCCEEIKRLIGDGKGLDILYMSQGYITFGGRDGELSPSIWQEREEAPLLHPKDILSNQGIIQQRPKKDLTDSYAFATTLVSASSTIC